MEKNSILDDLKIVKDYIQECSNLNNVQSGFSQGYALGTIRNLNTKVLLALGRLENEILKLQLY